jgi:MFS family permease
VNDLPPSAPASALKQSFFFTGNVHTLLPWYVAQFFASFCSALTTNAIYYFARYELHSSATVPLWLASLSGLVYIFASIYGGRWVDRIGQRKVILSMALVNVPIFLIAALGAALHSLPLLILQVVLQNIFVAPMWPAMESAMSCSPGTLNLTTRMTLYSLTWSISNFAAFGIVGSLAAWFTWPGVFVFASIGSFLVWLIITFFAISQTMIGAHHAEDAPTDKNQSKAVIHSHKARALLRMAGLSNMLSYMCVNTVLPAMPTITLLLGVKSYAIATALGSIWALTRVGGFLLAMLWTGWHYRTRWMVIFFIFLVVATEALLLSRSLTTLIVAQIIFGVAAAMLYSGSLYYAMHLSKGSGANAGLHEAMVGCGTTTGPAIAALAGAPGDLAPKAIALLAPLAAGGGYLFTLAFRTRHLPITSGVQDHPNDSLDRAK